MRQERQEQVAHAHAGGVALEDDDGGVVLLEAGRKVLEQLLLRSEAVQQQREPRVQDRLPLGVLWSEFLANRGVERRRPLEERVHRLGELLRSATGQVRERALRVLARLRGGPLAHAVPAVLRGKVGVCVGTSVLRFLVIELVLVAVAKLVEELLLELLLLLELRLHRHS